MNDQLPLQTEQPNMNQPTPSSQANRQSAWLIGRSMNKWQLLVILLAIVAIAWILLQQFMFKDCLNTMCPVKDYSYIYRIAIVLAGSSAAVWLLRK